MLIRFKIRVTQERMLSKTEEKFWTFSSVHTRKIVLKFIGL